MKTNPKFTRYFLWACLILSIGVFTIYCYPRVPKVTHDYGAYYKFSRALIDGRNVGALYDSTALNDPHYSYGIQQTDVSYNLPTNAFTLLPFAWMDAYSARIAWEIFSISGFIAAIIILLRIYKIPWQGNLGLGVLTLAFAWYPAYNNVTLGQLYMLLLFLFVLSLWGMTEKRIFLTSLPIAAALLLKGYGAIPLLWLLYHKRWREAAIVISTVIIVIAGTLPMLGVESWVTYYHEIFLKLGQMPTDSFVVYQAINNFMRHLFIYSKDWNPYPLMALPSNIIHALVIIINLLVVGIALIKTGGTNDSQKISYAIAMAVGVVTSPLSFEYHYILFLPLVIGLLAKLFSEDLHFQPSSSSIIILAAIVLMALPLHYADLQTASPPLILLAYPKLYAGLIILFIAVTSRRLGTAPTR